MSPAIEKPANLELSPLIEQLLATMFADYRRIIINRELGGGFSGGYILEVQPVKINGAPELPVIVKLATISMIQKEWEAYRQHIRYRLPYAAQVRDEPVLLPETGWGGLRYTLMGGSTFEVISLRDYCRQATTTPQEVCAVLERLLRIMRHIWQYHYISPKFQLRASYDHILPVNLLIQDKPVLPSHHPYQLTPDHLPAQPFKVGDRVTISGFAVHKANRDTQTVTLNRADSTLEIPAYYLRWKSASVEKIAAYPVNQVVEAFEGEVIETRASRFQAEIQQLLGENFDPTAQTVPCLDEFRLPNPLLAMELFLNQSREVRVASIHGDFHLENMLIEPETGLISLIDFADAREDHILHDFLRLETEVMTRLLPEILFQRNLPLIQTLASFYWQLHCTDFKGVGDQPDLPHPELEKPWRMLVMLRQVARQYFLEADDPTEYYQGLIIYLLGALKFKNLNTMPEAPLPKQAAFWAAALISLFLTTTSKEPNSPPPPLAPLISTRQQPGAMPVGSAAAQSSEPSSLDQAERRLAALPLHVIPTLAALPSRSRMPLRRNPLFIGRKRDLRAIARALKGAEMVAIGQTAATTGLGGIGKTQLACEFTHRYGQFFAGGVFWLSFADPKAVPAEVAACGRRGALALRADFEDRPLEEQVQLVMAAWESPIPRLLIFDNCEDPELLAQWRPVSGGCRILITSRRANWEAALGVEMLPLEVLSRWESMALLREHQPDADNEILDAIAKELGDLPLALHLAGSYMALYRQVITPAQYLAQLQDRALLEHRSLEGKGASPTEHSQNVRRAIALSYEQLDSNHEIDHLALKTLVHAACFAPGEPIPYHLLRLTLDLVAADPGATSKIEKAMTRLVELGLLRSEIEDMVRLHRLVVAFVRDVNLGKNLELAEEAVETAMIEEAARLNKAGYPAPLLAWQPHLRAVTDMALIRKDEQAARLCNELGWHLWDIAAYAEGQPYFEQAVTIRQRILGEDHPDTAHSLNSLGYLLRAQGKLAEAGPYFERALAIREKILGEEHSDTAVSLNDMGRWLYEQGDLVTARQYYERALAIGRKVLGEEHPLTAEYYNNVGASLLSLGQLEAVRPYYERALAINEKVLGPDHPNTALNLNNLGYILRALGKVVEAQPYHERALEIRRKVFGSEHPDIGRSLRNLGTVLQDQGDLVRGRIHLEQALVIHEKLLGREHPETAICLTYLGLLFQEAEDLDSAQQYLERALTIRQKALRPDHPLTADSFIYLGKLFYLREALESSQACLEQALAIRQKVLGNHHPLTAQNFNTLAMVLKARGELTRARSLYERALAIFESQCGPDHPDTNMVRINLAALES